MKLGNMIVDMLEYKDVDLYIYFKHYYKVNKFSKKILCLKKVKGFTYTEEELAYHEEIYEYLDNLKINAFTRVFYRNKKNKKIYILDANYSKTIVEFNEDKEWNYREQKN